MDDLLSEFLAETQESMEELDTELVKFEQNPHDEETLSKIFRIVHTIKGTCGFLNLPRLERISHAAETLLGQFRSGKLEVSGNLITLVLQSLDRIKMILDELAQTEQEPEGDDQDLITELNDAAANKAKVVAPAVAQSESAPIVESAPIPQTPQESAPIAQPEAEVSLEAIFDAPQPQETVAPQPAAPAQAQDAPEEIDNTAQPDIDVAHDPEAQVGTIPSFAEQITSAAEVLVNDEVQQNLPAAKTGAPAKTGGNNVGDHAGEHKGGGAQNSIRVSVDLLENLMTMVSELVLTRNQLLQLLRNRQDTSFSGPLQRLNIITSELQEGVMKTRMQPIGNAWNKLPRLIRDLNHELGKNINLKMIGAETELDRQVLEIIKDPLLHMIRNSADHGVETPEVRALAHKSEQGNINLQAYHEGGHIIIKIADDGAGIDPNRIRQKLIKNHIVSENEANALSDAQLNAYIFHPGFSTADKVSSVSGRGVGMDVVKTNIDKIGGTIELHSLLGRGTTFTIKIPLTLAIVQALIVKCGIERFAIPQISVMELVNVSDMSEHKIELIQRTPVLRLRNRLLPLLPLRKVLGVKPSERHSKTDIHRIALELVNQEALRGFVKNQESEFEETSRIDERLISLNDDELELDHETFHDDTIDSDSDIVAESEAQPLVTKKYERLNTEHAVDERYIRQTHNRKEEETRRSIATLGDANLSEIEAKLTLGEKRQVGRYLQIMHSIGGTMNNYIVVTKVGNNYFGIIVEQVNDTEEIVVKPTGRIIRDIPYFSGNTILGDGSVIMIIDPNGVGRVVGDIHMGGTAGDEDEQDSELQDHSKMTLLLFQSGEGVKKAVPLGVVARLEEIDMRGVEYPNNQPAVQYRGKLMPIVTLDNESVPTDGKFPVLVFSDDTHSMGLIVQEINDIVEERLEVQMTTESPGIVGSTIIRGEATDIIDPEFYWKAAFTEQLGHDLYMNSVSRRVTQIHKVLLIDANDVYRDLVVPYLSASGHRVTTVNSVQEANELQQRQVSFDAIIADIDSFGEEIFSFASQLRESGPWSTLPMLAVTANVHAIDTEAGYIAGFTDFIVKSDKRALVQSLLMFKT
ncbi:MAG: chemotaxis protein CheW [Alphaproteobacteria bacterium]|nr:chemotaxis protein CheW [Alphaproteobacteria bacterium]